jgi:hypothetical protein
LPTVNGTYELGVAREIGTFPRNRWVPVPIAGDLDELNALDLAACGAEEGRMLSGRSRTVGEALAIEREHLLLPSGEGSTWPR